MIHRQCPITSSQMYLNDSASSRSGLKQLAELREQRRLEAQALALGRRGMGR